MRYSFRNLLRIVTVFAIVIVLALPVYANNVNVSIATFGGSASAMPGFSVIIRNINRGDSILIQAYKGSQLFAQFSSTAAAENFENSYNFSEVIESQNIKFVVTVNDTQVYSQSKYIKKGSGASDGKSKGRLAFKVPKLSYSVGEVIPLTVVLDGIENTAVGDATFTVTGENISETVFTGTIIDGKVNAVGDVIVSSEGKSALFITAHWGSRNYEASVTTSKYTFEPSDEPASEGPLVYTADSSSPSLHILWWCFVALCALLLTRYMRRLVLVGENEREERNI